MALSLRTTLTIGLLAAATAIAPTSAQEAGNDFPLMEAGRIAYADFSRQLQSKYAKTGELATYLSSVENYQFTLRQTSEFYVITVEPVQIQGETIYGGGGEYRISKEALRIVEFVGHK